jgi:transposase
LLQGQVDGVTDGVDITARNAARAADEVPARIVGIDDWSWRKSWRYGTIIVDLERRKVVDILEDRSMSSVAQWLKRHPSIEVVSRDRCGLYAQATREGAPQASQVADRFHLFRSEGCELLSVIRASSPSSNAGRRLTEPMLDPR